MPMKVCSTCLKRSIFHLALSLEQKKPPTAKCPIPRTGKKDRSSQANPRTFHPMFLFETPHPMHLHSPLINRPVRIRSMICKQCKSMIFQQTKGPAKLVRRRRIPQSPRQQYKAARQSRRRRALLVKAKLGRVAVATVINDPRPNQRQVQQQRVRNKQPRRREKVVHQQHDRDRPRSLRRRLNCRHRTYKPDREIDVRRRPPVIGNGSSPVVVMKTRVKTTMTMRTTKTSRKR